MSPKRLFPAMLQDALERSFWLLPAIGLLVGALGGVGMVALDQALEWRPGLIRASDEDATRGVLQTIATVTVSVAGIAFSVTVVALQLASQQLSPRILRSFQTDRLSQSTLAVFLGLFVYALVVLARMPGADSGSLSVTLAVLVAVVAFALFAAFIHNIVISLQASTLIRRTAADARGLIKAPFPTGIGCDPEDRDEAASRLEDALASGERRIARSPRAGYVVAIGGEALISAAKDHDGVVKQLVPIGDFVLTGGALAEISSHGDDADQLADEVSEAFEIATERTLAQDVAFPIRQLADVALKGVSPSINDPTTAENAMDSLADAIVVFAHYDLVPSVRSDDEGEPRFLATVPRLNDLVRLGFDQVRGKAAAYPTLLRRLLVLLDEIERAATGTGLDCSEVERQRELIVEGAKRDAPTDADAETVAQSV